MRSRQVIKLFNAFHQEPYKGELFQFELEISGRVLDFSINVISEEATLSDIVPIARKISSKMANAILQGIKEKGINVPCRKGCCSCCSSLIPMSVPEVFRMREEFMAKSNKTSNRLLRRCIKSAVRILEKTEYSEYLKDFAKLGKRSVGQVNKWYGELKQVCPLLSGGLCMLYEQRPIACREHIVTGSSDSCKQDHLCRPNVVPIKVSVLEALGELASELEGTEVEAIMLPFSQAWVQDNLWRAERKWSAMEMVRLFAEILKQKESATAKPRLELAAAYA
ncbi:MAG: hypothetical protein A2Y10_16260 [Planctomycetes bacterium GWF2_41_51]|nr:MAG: hypothetical protein A2Y10_16260 [Planctomycetes bacterium GWF2_41_51]HBG26574.1 hypothetical protein [Phycisphaerales bacterium]